MKRVFWICAAIAFAGASPLAAQSLKSIRAQQSENENLASEMSYTNSVCGGSIKSEINWARAADWPDGASLASACDGALSALEAICRADGGKKRAASIKKFVCSGDGAGPSLSGGTLTYGASPGGNGFAETKAFLDGAL